VTLCASFCWKSLSRPFLYNLDSTPPQVINAAANDGEPCSGGQSPSSQDSVPIHGGVPEFSGSVRVRPDFTSAKKARAAPNFYLGLGLYIIITRKRRPYGAQWRAVRRHRAACVVADCALGCPPGAQVD